MRYLTAICVVVFGLTSSSCAGRSKQVISAPSPMKMAMLILAEYPDRPEVTGVPDDLSGALAELLAGRNLTPHPIDVADHAEALADRRATLHRLSLLADSAGDADLVLLLEVQPRYFSLLSGRYRWTVQASLTIARPDRVEEAITTDVQFPIFMEFHHEREEEVLTAAAPLLERHLGFLLDEYLGGL